MWFAPKSLFQTNPKAFFAKQIVEIYRPETRNFFETRNQFTMRTLIIDDERLARNELRRMLENFPKINIVGEAANAD